MKCFSFQDSIQQSECFYLTVFNEGKNAHLDSNPDNRNTRKIVRSDCLFRTQHEETHSEKPH